MTHASLPEPLVDLTEPGTFTFDIGDAARGVRINRLGRALRDPGLREALVADEQGVLSKAGLQYDEIALIRGRDWTGLTKAGGHLQFILVIAAALGDSLWEIGAHHVGCAPEVLISACPRRITGLPIAMQEL